MKSFLFILLGFVLGVIFTIAVIFAGALLLIMPKIDIYNSLLEGSCIFKVDPSGRRAIKLDSDEMLFLSSGRGKALIDFIKFGDQDGESTYRWRFKPSTDEAETSGTGKVYEKYEKILTNSESWILIDMIVRDIGSELIVHAGGFQVEWSYASKDFGWLYYDPNEITVEILPDADFKTYTLK